MTVTIGWFDVTAELVVPSHRDVMAVISQLECLDDVVESESLIVSRKFSAFEEWHPAGFDEQTTQILRSGGAVINYAHRDWVEPIRLTAQELEIAGILARDGRATYAAVAAQTGISESTAARRVESLTGVVSADLSMQVQVLKRARVPIDAHGRPTPQELP